MPEFKHISTLEKMRDRCDIFALKILCGISVVCAVADLNIGEVCEILSENVSCSFGIAHIAELNDLVHGNGRDLGGNKKSSVLGNTLNDCFRRRNIYAAVTGAFVIHNSTILL